MTAKKVKAAPLTEAADSLLRTMEKKVDETNALYRVHIQELVKADFLNVTFSVGNISMTWTGSLKSARHFHMLVTHILEIVSGTEAHDEPYEGKNGMKTPGYA